ncbi:hypothetical protein SKAU_G00243220 [Synaphobranchus kaupii]|uniref:ATP-binding cassette sub-family A member 12 n=1 Tax=Synaphobranchus kaupii TaxID=118154 RepID=A0A9Q1F7W1_SYNKA|nr:hypothetical protein SKAU_G00243220 [Synaphobranchus kaupii]
MLSWRPSRRCGNAPERVLLQGWSVALLVWPLVIFIILAITRSQFPPNPKETCYVAPRNLPSAGFFPFLQTLMCTTDSTCSNKSHLARSRSNSAGTARAAWSATDAHSLTLLPWDGNVLKNLKRGRAVETALMMDSDDQPHMSQIWDQMLNSSFEGIPNKTVLMATLNSSLLEDQEVINAMLESVNLLKKSMCNVSLSILKDLSQPSIDPFVYGLVTFCKTNDTLLEVILLTLNQVITEVLLNNPMEALSTVGEAAMVFNELQLQRPLWETILGLPRLFIPGSKEGRLNNGLSLLQNVKRTLVALQSSFPHVPVAMATPALDQAVSLLHYIRDWPGRGVYIHLIDVMVPNINLSAFEAAVVPQVKVPLDKAAVLMDYPTFQDYVCTTSVLSCGGEEMFQLYGLFGWIRQDLVIQQVFQAWSQHVASSDVTFVTRMLNGLLETYSPGSKGVFSFPPTSSRNSSVQAQSMGEQLFLDVGTVALDLLRGLPGWGFVRTALMGGHASMELATQILETMQEQMQNVLKDSHHIQQMFLSLMQDEASSNIWAERAVGSAVEIALKVLFSPSPVACRDLLVPWAWLSKLSSMPPELWQAVLCPANDSRSLDALLAQWTPVVIKLNRLLGVVKGSEMFNVTVPVLLSDWRKLCGNVLHFGTFLGEFSAALGENYWAAWIPKPTNITVDWSGILKRRGLEAFVEVGRQIEKSPPWPGIETYFHVAYWIMTFKPNITAPPNCTVDPDTMVPLCRTGFTWEEFVLLASSLMQEFSIKPIELVRCVQGSLAFLQSVYGKFAFGIAMNELGSPELLPGDGSIQSRLDSLIQILDRDMQLLSNISPLEQFDSQLSHAKLGEAIEALGLKPLEVLWTQGLLNASDIIGAITLAAQNNQKLLSVLGISENRTDPTVAELEALVFRWLSKEGRISLPLSLSMSDVLLTYSASLNSTDLEYLQNIVHSLTNQSASGVSELVLRAMQVLKQVMEAPGDPSMVILGYLRQLQDFLISALQLQSYTQLPGQNGVSPAQFVDLRPVALQTLQLLQGFNMTGDRVALDTVLRHLGGFIPADLHPRYEAVINQTHILIGRLSTCTASGLDCTTAVSHVFQILSQAKEYLGQTTNGTVIIQLLPGYNSPSSGQSDLPLSTTVDLLSLLLLFQNSTNTSFPLGSEQNICTQTLYFLQQILSTPNISLGSLQEALLASDLTLKELDMIAELAGSANISALLADLMGIADVLQCFQTNPKNMSLPVGLPKPPDTDCIVELIMRTTGFLEGLNKPQETQMIYLTMQKLIQFWASKSGDLGTLIYKPGEDPLITSMKTLTILLENIQENLHDLFPEFWPQINNEIQLLKGLLHLANETFPFTSNSTQQVDHQTVSLEMMKWYLKKLQDVTHGNNISMLLYPMIRMAELQLAQQVAQLKFQVIFEQEMEDLTRSVQLPLNKTDFTKIDRYIIAVLKAELRLMKEYFELQREYNVIFNQQTPDILEQMDAQVTKYMNLASDWLRDADLTSVIGSIVQWDAGSLNLTTPGAEH